MMSDAPDEQLAHGDVDLGDGHLGVAFVIAHEAPPSDHPTEAALDHLTERQELEACLQFVAMDHLQDEVEIGGLVHPFQPVMGAVGKEVLHPRPTLADGGQDTLRLRGVRYVGRSQMDNQKPAVGIDRDVPFAPDNVLGSVVTSCFGVERFDGLAVENVSRRAGRMPDKIAV